MTEAGPTVCARCHIDGRAGGGGGGCCRSGPRGAEAMFGLTWPEIKTISRAAGARAEELFVSDRARPEVVETARRLHPALARTLPGGRRLRLKLTPEGDCVLLGDKGCLLPREARPLFCRLFPVFVDQRGELVLAWSEGCLALAQEPDPLKVLELLGGSPAETRSLMAKMVSLARRHRG